MNTVIDNFVLQLNLLCANFSATNMRNGTSNPLSPDEIELYFSEDYLHFADLVNPPEASDRESGAVWELLSLRQGSPVLELGCGYGRITNRLAEKGARVTGLDISPILLKKAELDAAESTC
ncbi:methyltransferase domain-containing protein [Mesorhizobium sp. M0510]|uniref:class I SAM-dependent methyltransferase n=1 Tax=Mesorhizobium sp. M0510 TaxID=2956954 RepID=UPI00333CBF89